MVINSYSKLILRSWVSLSSQITITFVLEIIVLPKWVLNLSRCEPLWPTVTCSDGWNPKPKRKKREEDITDDVPTSNSKTIFSTKGTWGKKCVRFGFKKFRYASKRLGSIQFTLDGNPILFGINNIEYWHIFMIEENSVLTTKYGICALLKFKGYIQKTLFIHDLAGISYKE